LDDSVEGRAKNAGPVGRAQPRSDDPISDEALGLRRYGRIVALPLSPRLKVRLGRAIVNALTNPQRCLPTLRRTTLVVVQTLRSQSPADDAITAQLRCLVEEIALSRGLSVASLLSGRPRWVDLADQVASWIANAGESA